MRGSWENPTLRAVGWVPIFLEPNNNFGAVAASLDSVNG